MDKLKMMSMDNTQENIEKIKALFPNCVTEVIREGKVELAVDFDMLKQEMSSVLIDDKEERYQFTWPDKKKSVLLANTPSSATLRPCKEESVNFDSTENLYIEGDNLDVLKLLQETYLGKVKMIYIDPPYNTGNDFVYEDDFAINSEEYKDNSGQYDEQGNRLFQNTESNGRFHTDWLNMMYPRLKLAKDLLTDDGVIFISIDDNEQANLKKLCDEVFGESNFVGEVTWAKKRKGSFLSKGIISITEYLLVYAKDINVNRGLYGGEADKNESQPIIKRTNNNSTLSIPANIIFTKLENGTYKKGVYGDDVNPVELLDNVEIFDGKIVSSFRIKAPFVWSQRMFDEQLEKGAKFVINTLNFQIRVFKIFEDDGFKGFPSYISGIAIKGTNEDAYEELENIFKRKKLFDYSKPVNYIKMLVDGVCHFDKNSIILDFFSGSATTAHAVMQLNAEDGGNRKFICVQLPEVTDEKSEAYKAGYKNICEIGKERIRRAGLKIKNDRIDKIDIDKTKLMQRTILDDGSFDDKYAIKVETKNEEYIDKLDIGFRVLKLDSSNMKEVFYKPNDYEQNLLDNMENNIKEDRTALDLLFQVMLDLGKPLSSKIEEKLVAGKKVYVVSENDLVCCFDSDVTDEVVKAIAELKPLYAVFRDSSLSSDSVGTNFDQIFATYSPNTVRKVI